MLILLGLIVFSGALLTLIFFAVPLKISTVIIAAILILFGVLQIWPWWLFIPIVLLFLLSAGFLNLPFLRRKYLSKPIFTYFRKVLPPISDTERIALEAGEVWWEGELFRGKPDWQKLHALPQPQLNSAEQNFLEKETDTLCGMLNDWEIVNDKCDLSSENWQYLKDNGFFGLVIEDQYQGHQFSALGHSTIVTKIATRSMSAAINIMVPNSLGPAELIHRYGTAEQKEYFLPRLANGEEIPCFGLTSPIAGSDATAIIDAGIVCRGEYEGNSIVGIRLNWNKRYITLAPVATVLGLAFKLYDPNHLLGDQKDIGITLALIPTDYPGVEKGNRHVPLHLAFMNGPIRGKDVFIPLNWLIGGPEMRGKGWQMLMECLALGRGISLPALSTGAAKLSFRTAGAYAKVRKQFKISIGQLEGIQEALARIGGFTYLCEATRIMTASAVDQHVKPALASAITKYHLTELSRKIVNDAMDIHGGKTIQLGPKNYLGLVYYGLPTSITVEGANILTRNLIIFGQGAIRCHPYVLK
jgi:acyl-CoA dehydrogenase